MQEYAEHEKSREHVELAYERIVSSSFRARQKKGYRPGRGKRGERSSYEVPPTLLQKLITRRIDRGNTLATIARDMAVWVVLGVWLAASHPFEGAPNILCGGFAIFRLTKKRTLRNPDGPWFGNSPVFGALFQTAICWVLALAFISTPIARYLPWHELGLIDVRVQKFVFAVSLGLFNIFLR